jgi:cytochrome c
MDANVRGESKQLRQGVGLKIFKELIMASKHLKFIASHLLTALALVAVASPVWSFDSSEAEQQLKANNCVKCHAVDRKKDGPAYRDVAAKFRTQPDAEKKVIYHITSGEMVKLPDGHEERHKKIKSNNEQQLQNLARWILSLEGGTKY